MYVVINTTSPPFTSVNLDAAHAMRRKSLNRLSCDIKIVNPADGAGAQVFSIRKLAALRKSAVAVGISNAFSLLNTQEGALKLSGKLRERMNARRLRSSSPKS